MNQSVANAFTEDGSMPEDGLLRLIEQAKKAAKVVRDITVAEVVDLSMFAEVQKELGVKGK